MWRMLVGFLLPSLPPAGGVYPSSPALFRRLGLFFFFFSWPPFASLPAPLTRGAGERREGQTQVWILTRGEFSSIHPNSQPSPGTGQPQTGPFVCSEFPNCIRLCTISTHISLQPLVLDTPGIPTETQREHGSPGRKGPGPSACAG